MNLTEFSQRYHEQTFEWVRGEEVELVELPLGLRRTLQPLANALDGYAHDTGMGDVFVYTPFALVNDANEVSDTRTPDVMLYRHGRVDQDPSGTLLTYPDLAVEIIYHAEDIPAMYRKTLGYLKLGVQQVWLIDPDMHTLSIYRQGTKEITVLGTRHKMQDNEMLPGFEFNIVDMFG